MANTSWFQENKKWFLPTIINSVFFLIVGSILVSFIYVVGVVKTSKIYTLSMEKAQVNKDVQQLIGKKIKGSYFVDGNISVSHLSGEADFEISISGSAGEGKLRVVAQKVEDKWIYSSLEVHVENSKEVVDLLEEE